MTIPGAVSGWAALSQRFGTLPFADLFAPAIRYARDGYAVSPVVADKWALAVEVLPHELGFAEHFLPHGRAPRPGELFRCPPMARTLESIAATHGNAFYRGELAEAMVAHAGAHGALHTLADFAAHTLDWVAPLGLDYGGATVHEIPPNGQGIAALMALGILRAFDLASLPARFGREPAPADRGDEARVRRRVPLRERPADHGVPGAAHCSIRITSPRAHGSSIRSARRISAPASRRVAAPCICARPTSAG